MTRPPKTGLAAWGRYTTTWLAAGCIPLVVCVDPILGGVALLSVLVLERARVRAHRAWVDRAYGSEAHLIALIERDTERLHGLYRQHGVPERDWEH